MGGVKYGFPESKYVADPKMEMTVPFSIQSRLTAVEDRAVSILNGNKALKDQIRDLNRELEETRKEILTMKREITAEVKGLIDETIYGYLFENKTLTITKIVTKQFHVSAPRT